jgi:hypothetical protein
MASSTSSRGAAGNAASQNFRDRLRVSRSRGSDADSDTDRSSSDSDTADRRVLATGAQGSVPSAEFHHKLRSGSWLTRGPRGVQGPLFATG